MKVNYEREKEERALIKKREKKRRLLEEQENIRKSLEKLSDIDLGED